MESDPTPSPRLVLEGVHAPGGGRDADLCDVDLRLHPGELVLVLTARGAGLRTLLAAAAGRLAPSEGSVCTSPEEVVLLPERAQVGTHVRLAELGPGLGADPVDYRRLVHALGLGEGLRQPAWAVEPWFLQRSLLAGALTSSRGLLLLEDPLGWLDLESLPVAREALEDFRGRGGAVLMGAYRDGAPPDLTDRVAALRGGRLVAWRPAPEGEGAGGPVDLGTWYRAVTGGAGAAG